MLSKTKYITLAIIGVVILGFSLIGYFKSVSAPEPGAGPQPKIEITPREFDFGDKAYGDVLEYSFKVKNAGTAPLEIKRVATSCSCTTAKIATEIIEPGQTADLAVTYDTAVMSGSHGKGWQERIIYVKSNDPLIPQATAMIYADVR